jgi:hypothetical protein
MPLILDKDRELPEILEWIPETAPVSPLTPGFLQNAESSGQEPETPAMPVKRGGSETNRWREKPPKLHSPPTPDNDTPIERYVHVRDRRAQTISGRHENIRSLQGDIAYISPRLEQEIDDVENYWMTGGVGPSEDSFEILKGVETELIQHKGKGKAKAGRKVEFDDFVRDGTRWQRARQ